jgi:AcrR family transcriptional regulator
MAMPVPYELSGRRQQKARTREALTAATRQLMARGETPTVEDAAEHAGISRTTAYRYFPNQRALLLGAHPETLQESLLPDDAPDDPQARLELVMRTFTRATIEWEPQLRAALRLSLELSPEPGAEQPMLRRGRAVGWIEDALSPLRTTNPEIDVHRLAVAIRSATGIEALIWLTDIAGLPRSEAADLICSSARALLRAALTVEV